MIAFYVGAASICLNMLLFVLFCIERAGANDLKRTIKVIRQQRENLGIEVADLRWQHRQIKSILYADEGRGPNQ